jgi:hypothetical protein
MTRAGSKNIAALRGFDNESESAQKFARSAGKRAN